MKTKKSGPCGIPPISEQWKSAREQCEPKRVLAEEEERERLSYIEEEGRAYGRGFQRGIDEAKAQRRKTQKK
jgi:hypothetical protein